jgi:hypothetical protein
LLLSLTSVFCFCCCDAVASCWLAERVTGGGAGAEVGGVDDGGALLFDDELARFDATRLVRASDGDAGEPALPCEIALERGFEAIGLD